MKIFPAIDLYGGKAVRLYKGDYDNMTVYSENPVEVARDFENCGAKYIHLVDLEGAKFGTTPNIDTVADIVKSTGLFTEIGGGIRSAETVEKYLEIGVSRVILGTAAVENRDFLVSAVERFGDKIAVGADVRDGFIAVKGWTQSSGIALDDFVADMEKTGIRNIICTDISKDGAMRGTNLQLYSELSEKFGLDITASGGVSTMDDIIKLREMKLYGAIIGKAYYTGAIDLRRAIEVAE